MAYGQSFIKDSVMNAVILSVNYSYQLPFGDMKDRYGGNSAVGGTFGFKVKKNFIFGFDGAFMFGNQVKNKSHLQHIAIDNNILMLTDGTLQTVYIVERGYMLKVYAGKIFPFARPNKNSGIVFSIGVGLMQHRLRFEVDKNDAPPLNEEYRKGYDRLTSGLVVAPFIGYQYMSTSKRMNVYGGIEFNAGFTQGRRTWNYDTNSAGDGKRKDMLIAFKVGWMLPLYFKATDKYYYY